MDWLRDYQLVLFDFDGLLVNTERLHYEAYTRMFHSHDVPFDWDFQRYCLAAHYDATALREQVYELYPEPLAKAPEWAQLYNEKKAIYSDLVRAGKVELMPGVTQLLQQVTAAGIKSCVVTNSPDDVVSLIREQIPFLNGIPHWVTREHYQSPKPDPECYRQAIAIHGGEGCHVLGFEDTVRGLRALTGALDEEHRRQNSMAVLVSAGEVPGADALIAQHPSLSIGRSRQIDEQPALVV